MKGQVEERLKFFSNGGKTEKNQDIMDEVLEELKGDNLYVTNPEDVVQKKTKKSKKNKK